MSDDEDDEDVGTSGTDASGKPYLLVQQTNYDAADDETHPLTYLQLGAYPTWGDEKERGDDLLGAIGLDSSTELFFKDDHRHANGQTDPDTVYTRWDGNATEEKEPSELTAELLTRGGWRLHTDGNYVSTTRGDRLDVVFGNYHQAVLGRGLATTCPAFWESSGGHTVRGDVSLRLRKTLVDWDAEIEHYRHYTETLKGNHTARFQGPLEEVFECESIHEIIGPDVEDGDEEESIPATSAAAHQQTDAADHWVNPSSGHGDGWPRKQEIPDVDETVRAKAFVEKTKVTGGLSASEAEDAGSITATRHVEDRRTIDVTATNVEDILLATGGATVRESVGFAPETHGGHIVDEESGSFLDISWEAKYAVAEYSGSIFEMRSDWEHSAGKLRVDLVAVDMSCHFGFQVTYTDMSEVDLLPGIVKPSWYKDKQAWNSGVLPVAYRVLTATSFGQSEMEIAVATPHVSWMVGARAAVHVLPMAAELAVDEVEASPLGTHHKFGLGHLLLGLIRNHAHAVHDDGAVVEIKMSGLHAHS